MIIPPFVRYVAGLAAGIVLYVLVPDGYVLPALLLTVGAGLLIAGYVRNASQVVKPISIAQGIGSLLLLGGLGWFITYQRTPASQPDNLLHRIGTNVALQAYEGVVATLPEERAKTYRVELTIRRGQWAGHWQALSGRVIVYVDKAVGKAPRYGEVWLVAGSPRPIDPPLNPGEFDYRRYLQYRGIYHQQYLRPWQRSILAVEPPSRLMNLATRVNRWADSVLTHQIGSRAEYGIVNAMILGVRDDLDTEQYRAYSAAGAVHILSVSGLHVGLLFQVLVFLLGFVLKRPRQGLMTGLPTWGRWGLAGLQLAILWFYALVTGMSPPVLRSAGMFSLLIVAQALGRQQHLLNTLGASAFLILLVDPYALFSAGFQLSNLAVAGIGAWQSSLHQSLTFRYGWLNKLWTLTAVALVAQLITFPLGVFYFHQFPTYFLLANPVVMGLSTVLLPLAMATVIFSVVPGLNGLLGWLLQKTAWLLNGAVSLTSQLPGANWDGLWLSPVGLVLTYALIVSAVTLLITRQRTYLWTTVTVALLLAVVLDWDEVGRAHQRRLAVHFLPHRTAVSLTEGHRSTLLTDLEPADTRSFDFYLKNTFGQWGVSDLHTLPLQTDSLRSVPALFQHRDYVLWVWRGTSLLIVNRLRSRAYWRLPAVVDYLIIRRNALRSWDELNGRIVARHIIFDDSNKTPLTDQLLLDARQRRIACYSVRQMGAYVADLN